METAKHVADKGDQAVVDAVKTGVVSVSATAKLVDAVPDKKRQRHIVKGGKKAVGAGDETQDEKELEADKMPILPGDHGR